MPSMSFHGDMEHTECELQLVELCERSSSAQLSGGLFVQSYSTISSRAKNEYDAEKAVYYSWPRYEHKPGLRPPPGF